MYLGCLFTVTILNLLLPFCNAPLWALFVLVGVFFVIAPLTLVIAIFRIYVHMIATRVWRSSCNEETRTPDTGLWDETLDGRYW